MGAVATGKALLDGDVEGAADPFGHISGLTGQAGADAALAGVEMQAQTAREALDYTKERDALQRSDLMPFTQWGSNAMPFYSAMLNPQTQANYLQSNPLFQAALNRSETPIKNRFGFSGLRGDMQKALTENYMAQGDQFIDRSLNRLMQPIQIAQASAAGQAANTGANTNAVNELLTGIGNAQAAGGIGAANSLSQGAGNVAAIGGSLLGAFLSDERAKTDIEVVGETKDGLPIYRWRYRGDDKWQMGPMAQDVEKMQPEAYMGEKGGLKHINMLLVH